MFNEVNEAATEQKKQNEVITLSDDILDEDNPFNNIKIDDIYIEDNLYDNKDSQNVKNISNGIIETIDLSCDIEIPSDTELATDPPKKLNIITHPNRTHIESCKILKKCRKQRQKSNLKQIKRQVNG